MQGAWVVAGVAAVIYLVPVITQLRMGLPFPEGGVSRSQQLLEAAHPRRVTRIWGPLLGQLALLRFAPRYIRWLQAHARHPANLKGVSFGSNHGSLLDVYTPVCHDSDSGGGGEDARQGGGRGGSPPLPPPPPPPRSRPSGGAPVLIFVYGGAWSAGSRATYASLGQRMAGLGFVAVVPDYVKYPEGTITDISSDVLRALLWLRREGAKQFGGNPRTIVLVGHSAGAHICAAILCTLFSKSVADAGGKVLVETTELTSDIEAEVADQRAGKILLDIVAFVGLAGVYNIADHYEHESARGVEHVSAMKRAMLSPTNFRRNSPLDVLAAYAGLRATWSQDIPPRLPACHLVHGALDYTVPLSSSKKFAAMLRHVDPATEITLHVAGDVDHIGILVALVECEPPPPRRAESILDLGLTLTVFSGSYAM